MDGIVYRSEASKDTVMAIDRHSSTNAGAFLHLLDFFERDAWLHH